MGRSDQERAYAVGQAVIYGGLLLATVVAGGLAGWMLPALVQNF